VSSSKTTPYQFSSVHLYCHVRTLWICILCS